MRDLCFLFPHFEMSVGGNISQTKFIKACSSFSSVEAVSYRERVEGYRHLDDVLAATENPQDGPIFVLHWGPDVPAMIERLQGADTVYIARSTGWGIDTLPSSVPILCVSKNTQGYWGRYAPNSPIRYVPNWVSFEGSDTPVKRDIDVLVQRRKSSAYLMDQLVPALKDKCNLVVLDDWVGNLADYFWRSKVYLYDSVDHWVAMGATEGFGRPPLEAMACGCVVFSSINDALSDFLDPGVNCRKIRVHSTEYDVQAVLRALREQTPVPRDPSFMKPYSEPEITERLRSAFEEFEEFFTLTRGIPSDITLPLKGQQPDLFQKVTGKMTHSVRRYLR